MRVVLSTIATMGWMMAMAAGPARAQHEAMHRPPDKIELQAAEVTVPFELSDGRPIVGVMLERKGPYRFILDTGAGGSVVDKALADELKLEVGEETQLSSPLGSGVPGHMHRIGRFALGGAVAHGVDAVSMDMTSIFKQKDAPRGVMSASMFVGCLLTLDYPNGRVVVKSGALPEANGADVFQYQAADHLPTVTISVAGVEAQAHLDSGAASGLMLPESYIKKLPLAGEPVAAGKMRTVDSERTVVAASLNGSVTMGRHVIEKPEIRFIDSPMGNIGYRILRQFAITIDSKNQRVKLEPGAAAPAATASASAPSSGGSGVSGGAPASSATGTPRRYGMKLRIQDDHVEVMDTDDGSIARKAGLQAGDTIVAINGTKWSDIDESRRGEILRVSPVTLTIERAGKSLEIRMALD